MTQTRKRRRTSRAVASALLMAALAALLVAPAALAGVPTWGSIEMITEDGQPAAGSSIATTKSTDQRYLHATFRRGAGKVLYARSSNGGDSWSAPVTLADVGMVFGEPRVAASGNDVWIAYARRYVDPDTGTPGQGDHRPPQRPARRRVRVGQGDPPDGEGRRRPGAVDRGHERWRLHLPDVQQPPG